MSIRLRCLVVVFACAMLSTRGVAAQAASSGPRDIWGRDSLRTAWLEQHGRTVRRPNAVVVAPADSLPEAWQQALADTLDRGVAALRRLIGGPHAWQGIASRPSTPITFYLSPERFPGHGTGRDAVFTSLPFYRQGTAGFLREASHELLVPTCATPTPCYPSPWERPDTVSAETTARFPNWLFWYGIAGYLAHTAADAERIDEDTSFDAGLAGADSACTARAAAHPRRAELLQFIGTARGPLFGPHTPDVRSVVPVMFPCTLSMTKFLVERMGLKQVIELFPAIRAGTWERDIERVAGESLPALRRRWLEKLKLDAGSAPGSAGNTAREIAEVEGRIDSALARRDTTALARLVADSFTFVHATDGRVDSRATWLAKAARGIALSRQRNERMAFDAAVTVYGEYTAVSTARVRLRIVDGHRDLWLQQTMMYVREPDGWRLAHGQGTRIYNGPPIDTALYRRYAGTYVIDSTRSLVLEWDGYALVARWPTGARVQTFLSSPTDELVASPDVGRLRFVLGADGRPTSVSLIRGPTVLWRAKRVRGRRDPPGSGTE